MRLVSQDASQGRRVFSQYHTTRIERLLLIATVVLLPLQDHIPPVGGFSVMFILFGALAGYAMTNRPDRLARTWLHAPFLAAYTFLCLGFLFELSHPYSRYSDIMRTGQMLAGAVFVASLCRDRRALRTCIYGYVIAGVWMSILLFLTAYGVLTAATATDFAAADEIRTEAFTDSPLEANLNGMAFIVAQGAVVALALALTAYSSRRRKLFLGISMYCLVAAFLPMSRGGIAIAIIACGAVMFTYGVSRARTILITSLLGATVVLWVPDAVFSRLTLSTEVGAGGKMEARAHIYTAIVEHLPEYMITGVGAGNFWGRWGRDSGFSKGSGVVGAHNIFAQVTIYWGLAALFAFMTVIWQAYRCIPRRCGNDGLALCLVGIAVSLFLYSLVVHTIYSKEFALGLGLLVGGRLWIWPQGIAQSTPRPQRRLDFSPRYSS